MPNRQAYLDLLPLPLIALVDSLGLNYLVVCIQRVMPQSFQYSQHILFVVVEFPFKLFVPNLFLRL